LAPELRFGLLSELGVIRGFIVNGVYPASHRLHKGILRGLFNEVHLLLPTMIKTPASYGSRQSKASLSMLKSFSLGEITPAVTMRRA